MGCQSALWFVCLVLRVSCEIHIRRGAGSTGLMGRPVYRMLRGSMLRPQRVAVLDTAGCAFASVAARMVMASEVEDSIE